MRITCTTIDGFFQRLDHAQSIFESTVGTNIVYRPVGPPDTSVVNHVGLQATALVEVAEGSEYILQVGIHCGKDYSDSSQSREGSEIASALIKRIEEYAAKRGWRVLPGVIED